MGIGHFDEDGRFIVPREVDEDMKRRARQESDCTMVTLLQPMEMLKSEVILHEAARTNSIDRVRKLISERVDVNSRNNLDRTALQWAAANGHVEVMKILVKAGADLEATDKYGMRPLQWAAWFGHKDALMHLVTAGAHVEAQNKQGLNIMHCAAQNNHVGVLQFIEESLEGFDVNSVEKHEQTGLHLAAEKGNVEVIEQLITMKCEVIKKDKSGQTPVHVAASNGQDEALRRLLLVGVEVDDRDNEGRTALHLAADGGHEACVNILLTHTADPNTETTKETTSLHMATQNGHEEVVKALLDNGCNVNAKNAQGNTPLHLAAMNNYPDIVQLIVDAGCDPDITNQRLQNPLHCAVENGFGEVVEVMLIAGADLEAKEKVGKNALALASRGSFIGIVDMIIKAERHAEQQQHEVSGRVQCGKVHHCFYSATCTALTNHRQHNDMERITNDVQFKKATHEGADIMKEIAWKLATKQLRQSDWKKLARHWKFSEEQIRAIEHQYTGTQSYKEHGFRLLLIWLHGIKKDENPTKTLFEALVAIDRRELAEQIRRKCNIQVEKSSPRFCLVS